MTYITFIRPAATAHLRETGLNWVGCVKRLALLFEESFLPKANEESKVRFS
jgi:hypothetical protein